MLSVKDFKHANEPKASDVGDTNEIVKSKDFEPVRRQIELNERSCSFLLFAMSFSFVWENYISITGTFCRYKIVLST